MLLSPEKCAIYSIYRLKSVFEADIGLLAAKTNLHAEIILEVKAEENLKARSLKAFCDKFSPDVAIRTSM